MGVGDDRIRAMRASGRRTNTREALFDAMERKETYATTGPRMIVRFFGGWDFDRRDAQNRMPAEIGYRKGVPMGGDLRTRAAQARRRRSSSPRSRTRSARTSTASRSSRAGSTPRARRTRRSTTSPGPATASPGADGKVPAVGNTVDVANATWTNTIGAPELITVWKDPELRRDAARVLLRARARDPDAALDGVRR